MAYKWRSSHDIVMTQEIYAEPRPTRCVSFMPRGVHYYEGGDGYSGWYYTDHEASWGAFADETAAQKWREIRHAEELAARQVASDQKTGRSTVRRRKASTARLDRADADLRAAGFEVIYE